MTTKLSKRSQRFISAYNKGMREAAILAKERKQWLPKQLEICDKICEELGVAENSWCFHVGSILKFSITKRELLGFTDPNLVEILEYLAEELGVDATNGYESAETLSREYIFEVPDMRLHICLTAYVKLDDADATCHRVIVGYEEVAPRPVYKAICD